MADKRMFSKSIIDSDAFLDLPLSAQALYFHLAMRADDEGFVNSPKKIQRIIGASDDDGKLLIMKKFLIPFDSGVVVIKHWFIHNYIRSDRLKATNYEEERASLTLKKNGAYSLSDGCQSNVSQVSGRCQSDDSQMSAQNRLDKNRLDEISVESAPNSQRFVAPSVSEVKQYIEEKGYHVDAEQFVDFYDSKGWMVGKNKMKDWKASVRTWEKKVKQEQPVQHTPSYDTDYLRQKAQEPIVYKPRGGK